MKKKLIIFTDIGDTIVDEGTEIRKVRNGVVYHADCVPEAKETLLELYKRGYTIAMVADGLVESFRNTMGENGLDHVFSAWSISEPIGVEKPNPLMFEKAMEKLGLTDEDKERIIMVGNNLSRDVLGANRFGIRSVHFCWSPRYKAQASIPEEEPTYRIYHASELLELAERLEKELEEKGE
ncbi:MAG: HAD family hydrolase [Acetatifactor sp.]|jgi:putative hydrolase of the HAD superfamily|nr:HAD family hydrolase [Acetatifactor sp.]